MNKIIFILTLVCLTNCSTQEQRNERVIECLESNFSYDWPRARISKELVNRCEQYYKSELKGEDELIFESGYQLCFEQTDYIIVEFDFVVAFDGRILFVFNQENGKLIGFFNLSLA